MRKHLREVEIYIEMFILWLAQVISEIMRLNLHKMVFFKVNSNFTSLTWEKSCAGMG